MAKRYNLDPVEEHMRSEGFYLREKSRNEREKNRFKPRSYRYDSRSRSRKIVFMDLLIIIIMMGVLVPFASKILNKPDDLYGFKAEWDYSFNTDHLYHSLTLTAPKTPREDTPDNLIIEAVFTATGGESVTVTDLPPEPGKERLITAAIPLEELPDYVGCLVKVGDRERTFKVFTGKVRAIPLLKRPGK
jgi:hypothetical protein